VKRIKDVDLSTLSADIIVIGSGAAGLTAAAAAAEKGAKVILLEKHNAAGGRSVRAEGFFAAESPVQERMGIDAPNDVLFRMAMDYAHWEINPRIVKAFIDKSGDTVRWLEEKGVRIDRVSPFYRNQCIRTWHQPEGGGAEIIEALLKNFTELGGIFIPRVSAKKIFFGSRGKVTGVSVVRKGTEYPVAGRAVIIATGGYGGNATLLKRYCPYYTEDIGTSGSAYQGEGLLMALEAGAATEDLGGLHINGPRFDGVTKHAGVLCQEPTTIWVNRKGERFTDESTAFNHYESVNAILQQPGKISYSLFDQNIVNLTIEKGPLKIRQGVYYGTTKEDMVELEKELRDQVAKGAVMISHSWEPIAKWIGVEPGVLASTVAEYNSFADRGYDEAFLKERRYLKPLTAPPYYAMRCRAGLIGTIGGIKVNHRMEVLDLQDNAIPGIYAAGTDVGGWEPRTYNVHLSGSTLGFPLNSGRIAGEEAAEFLLRK
jgi:fumarate reductase flavoprotein subunit